MPARSAARRHAPGRCKERWRRALRTAARPSEREISSLRYPRELDVLALAAAHHDYLVAGAAQRTQKTRCIIVPGMRVGHGELLAVLREAAQAERYLAHLADDGDHPRLLRRHLAR